MARLLVSRFGKRYAGHPRLESITKINKITDRDALTGAEEADAYKNHEFLRLHQSTLRKVDVIASILEDVMLGRLKTKAPFWDKYGGSTRLIWEKFFWTPAGRLISALLVIRALADWLFPDARAAVGNWAAGLLQQEEVTGETGAD
ncbi:hypothetical protein ACXN5S_09070 [Pseudoroseicyclus sp. H15]